MKTQEFLHGLYIIATPIGNLADFSERAKSVLSQVDWIAAEDTRETRKLLHHLGITKDLISMHEFSTPEKAAMLVSRIVGGQNGAYVSDAGTPAISDPGAVLVDAAFTAGLRVVPIPGASALTSILSVTGFNGASRSVFHGFIPREDLQEFWREASAFAGVHVFFESPHRVLKSLSELASVYPDAQIVMGRELTKHYEEIWRGSVEGLVKNLNFRPDTERRGEFVFALRLETEKKDQEAAAIIDRQKLMQDLAELGANQKVLTRLGEELGLSRNEAYKQALALKKS